MANSICAVTEASDKFFHLTRTSIYSFIEHNRWFDGTLKLLVHQDLPLSERNLLILKLIYPTIEIISINSQTTNKIKKLAAFRNSNKYLNLLFDTLKIFIFTIPATKILYFSNNCLFLNTVVDILVPGKIVSDENFSLAYIDGETNPIQLNINIIPPFEEVISSINSLNYIIIPALSLYSANYPNVKFNTNIQSKLKSSPSIVFNTFTSDSVKHSKINQVWLHKNHEILNALQKPSAFNILQIKEKPKSVIKPANPKPNIIKDSNLSFNCEESLIGKKLALCTISTDTFLVGTQVLIYSFLSTNPWYDQDIIVFYSKIISPLSIDSMNKLLTLYPAIQFREVDESNYSNLMKRLKAAGTDSRFFPSLFTFESFDLTSKYDKILYLDSDMLIRSNISELFLIFDQLVVTPDAGEYNLSATYFTFNGGFLLIDSQCSKFNYKMKLLLSGEKSNDLRLADQNILNDTLQSNVKMLNSKYNCLKRCFPDNNFNKFDEAIKIIHYVGAKPWHSRKIGKESNYVQIEQLWKNSYSKMIDEVYK